MGRRPVRNVSIACLLGIVLLMPAGAQSARAAEDELSSGGVEEWTEEGLNTLSLFVGAARWKGDHGFSLGLDYERRLSRRFGVGGLIEYTGQDFRAGIAVATCYWHAWRELKLMGSAGMEAEREDGSHAFLLRVGVEYGFSMGKGFEVAPAVFYDYTHDAEAVVYGLGFAKKF